VVETLANQLSGRQQDAGIIRRQGVKIGDQRRTLFPRHSPVQHERCRHLSFQGCQDGIEVIDPDSADGKAPDSKKVLKVFEETRRMGLLIGKGGLYSNVIRISPPMIVSSREIDDALALLDKAFAAVG